MYFYSPKYEMTDKFLSYFSAEDLQQQKHLPIVKDSQKRLQLPSPGFIESCMIINNVLENYHNYHIHYTREDLRLGSIWSTQI